MALIPFDDTQAIVRPPPPTRNGYDTSSWDQLRQGIELKNDRFRFMGTQPKLWSGTTSGESSIITYGQQESSIEDDVLGLASKYEDLPRFNPSEYIRLGGSYPFPIVFNDGPGQTNDASVEPFTIPYLKKNNEGPYYAHAVRGELEDGNNIDGGAIKSSNRIEQFVDITSVQESSFFLDEGGDFLMFVERPPYICDVQKLVFPFDDSLPYSPEHQLNTTDVTIQRVIREGSVLGEDLLPYGKKSAAAGHTYYSNTAGQYGTDSIAFGGWYLGN